MKLSIPAVLLCIGAALPSAAQMRIDGSRVIEGTLNFCADTGTSGAYACNLMPAIGGYVAGSQYCFQANSTNAGAATLNLNGLGPKAVRKYAGGSLIDLDANDIIAGQRVCVIYDGTYMQLSTRLANEGGALWKTAGPGGMTAGTVCKYNTDGTIVPVIGNESIVGICATTTNSGVVGKLITVGNAACIAEGAVTQNDYVGVGATNPSHCKDLGQSARNAIPGTTYIAGRAATSAADGGTVTLELFGPGMSGTQTTGAGGYSATASSVPAAGCAQWDDNGNVGSTGANCGSGSGSGSGALGYSASGLSLGGTLYVPVTGGGGPSATESTIQVPMVAGATISNFYVQIGGAPGNGNTLQFTLRNMGVDQLITCSISGPAATGCNDTVHSVIVNSGNLLSVKIVATGTFAANQTVAIAMQYGSIGAGAVQTGTANQIAYYPGNGATLSGQSFVPVAQGGTGQTTYADGQLLIGSSSGNSLSKGTLTGAGSLNVINGHGSVTLTGGSGMGCAFDGGGAVVAGNSVCYARAPFGCTIQSWSIVAQGAGPTATVDIWRVASGTALPTVAATIAGSSKPALSAGNANASGALTGWATSVLPGDIFGFHIDAVSNATWIEVRLVCQ